MWWRCSLLGHVLHSRISECCVYAGGPLETVVGGMSDITPPKHGLNTKPSTCRNPVFLLALSANESGKPGRHIQISATKAVPKDEYEARPQECRKSCSLGLCHPAAPACLMLTFLKSHPSCVNTISSKPPKCYGARKCWFWQKSF